MNKAVAKILKQLAKEAVKHPEVRRQAEKLATVASRKAVDLAQGASQWLRERRAKMDASEAESRRPPPRKNTARKSAARKSTKNTAAKTREKAAATKAKAKR